MLPTPRGQSSGPLRTPWCAHRIDTVQCRTVLELFPCGDQGGGQPVPSSCPPPKTGT